MGSSISLRLKFTATTVQRARTATARLPITTRGSSYGWTDLDLGHGFHDTKQGTRFSISERARVEILDLLLALNHERYRQEVAKGLHGEHYLSRPNHP